MLLGGCPWTEHLGLGERPRVSGGWTPGFLRWRWRNRTGFLFVCLFFLPPSDALIQGSEPWILRILISLSRTLSSGTYQDRPLYLGLNKIWLTKRSDHKTRENLIWKKTHVSGSVFPSVQRYLKLILPFFLNWEAEIKKMFPGLVYILKLSARLKISIDIFWSVISTPLPAKIIEQEEKAVNAAGL